MKTSVSSNGLERIKANYLRCTQNVAEVAFKPNSHTQQEIIHSLACYWISSCLAKRVRVDTGQADMLVVQLERDLIANGIIHESLREVSEGRFRDAFERVVTRGITVQ